MLLKIYSTISVHEDSELEQKSPKNGGKADGNKLLIKVVTGDSKCKKTTINSISEAQMYPQDTLKVWMKSLNFLLNKWNETVQFWNGVVNEIFF